MEEVEVKKEEIEVFNEAKIFLEKAKKIVFEAKRLKKKVIYFTNDLLILSLEEGQHTVFEVFNNYKEDPFTSEIMYLGDPKLRGSYLLNLINKQEMKYDLYKKKNV